MASGACHVAVQMGRLRGQETVRGGDGMSGSELTHLFLVGEFLGPLRFQKLLMLESELSILLLEELLLLQLDHAVRLLQFLLTSQLCSGDALLLLLQGFCRDRGSA